MPSPVIWDVQVKESRPLTKEELEEADEDDAGDDSFEYGLHAISSRRDRKSFGKNLDKSLCAFFTQDTMFSLFSEVDSTRQSQF